MSDPKLISPLLDNYMMGDPISEKSGSRCCPALERDLQTKCIVKITSTPASQGQLEALLLSGAYTDTQAALEYFRSIANEIVDEVNVLQRLSQLEGFFPFIGCQIVPMDDGVGFDVYTLSEYRKTLQKLLKGENLTHLAAVNLGLDICTALAVCRRIGYLYVNLKPENIYLADNKTWKIGDIGFLQLSSLKFASLPERYRSEYTAPEIEDAFASLNTTLDVYALGLILYRIYNGNQLPSNLQGGSSETLVPPDYADYEMSEIILKACDPDPEKRWQDPIEMGQALVSYMQRNSVNDTPIVPPPVIPEVPEVEYNEEAASPETIEQAELPAEHSEEETGAVLPADDISELLAPSEDETAPEQNEDQLVGIQVSPEVSEILSQADEMAQQQVPEMPVSTIDADEAPAEITPDESLEEPASSDNEETAAEPRDAPSEETSDENAEEVAEETEEAPVAAMEAPEIEQADEGDSEGIETAEVAAEVVDSDDQEAPEEYGEDDNEIAADGKKTHWIRNLLIAGAALLLAALAFLFYTKYYLQTIDALDVVKDPNGVVSVLISTKADETKLSVVCADVYGNPRRATVDNGVAIFDTLAPGSAYTVTVEIDGFHKLTGKTTASFTTPNQLQILQLEALTGLEDGSVILTFATKDQDSEEWSVTYVGDDGSEIVETFEGHMHTITGLTVGNEYNFTIAPETDIKYTGTTEVKHTASAVIAAEDIRIDSIANGKMRISWTASDGLNAEGWNVHCFNSNGFDQAATVDTTNAVFEGIDPASPYTVEISAIGMSTTTRTDVPANAVIVTNFTAKQNGTAITLNWTCASSNIPENWLLSYGIGSLPLQEISCASPTLKLENAIPDTQYTFTLNAADGTEVVGGQLIYNTAKAEKFSAYKVTAADMHFYACRTPSKSNWTKKDLKASDYTTTFKVGEKMSFLAELKDTYNPSNDKIVTIFVFRDENGNIAAASTSEQTWKQMWLKGLGEFDVPSTPETPGQYTVAIYMNGKLADESSITITQ